MCVSRTVRRDVGVSGGSTRGAARQQRESRGGRAVAGRQALAGRALLRMQPERPVQAVQRQPVRVLQQVQKDVGAQGQIGNRLHLVGSGPETLAGLFAGDAMACVTFQRQTQKGKPGRGDEEGTLPGLCWPPVEALCGLVATGEAPVGLYVCSSCHCTGVHAFNVGH